LGCLSGSAAVCDLTLVSTPILRNWLNETFNRSADSQSFLVETVTGIHAVKAHAAEEPARDLEGLFARFIAPASKPPPPPISSNIGNFLLIFPAYSFSLFERG